MHRRHCYARAASTDKAATSPAHRRPAAGMRPSASASAATAAPPAPALPPLRRSWPAAAHPAAWPACPPDRPAQSQSRSPAPQRCAQAAAGSGRTCESPAAKKSSPSPRTQTWSESRRSAPDPPQADPARRAAVKTRSGYAHAGALGHEALAAATHAAAPAPA